MRVQPQRLQPEEAERVQPERVQAQAAEPEAVAKKEALRNMQEECGGEEEECVGLDERATGLRRIVSEPKVEFACRYDRDVQGFAVSR